MKFRLETIINRSHTEVWKAFDNIENLQKCQPTLTSHKLLNGTAGQPGAVTKLTYEEGGREFSLIEKITHRIEPNELDSLYENNFADFRPELFVRERSVVACARKSESEINQSIFA